MPDGQYTIQAINQFLTDEMIANGDFPGPPATPPIQILPNFSTGKVDILINDVTFSLQLDTGSTFHLLLGFAAIDVTVTQTGTLPANINNGITNLLIHCSLASSSYLNDGSDDSIHSIAINAAPFESITFSAPTIVWLPMEQRNVDSVTMRLSDQDNNTAKVALSGEPISYQLLIRKRRDQTVTINK